MEEPGKNVAWRLVSSVLRRITTVAPLAGAVVISIVVALAKVYAVVAVPLTNTKMSVVSRYGKVMENSLLVPFPV